MGKRINKVYTQNTGLSSVEEVHYMNVLQLQTQRKMNPMVEAKEGQTIARSAEDQRSIDMSHKVAR